MNKRAIPTLLSAVLLLPCAAAAQQPSPPAAAPHRAMYTLRYAFDAGQIRNYKSTIAIRGAAGSKFGRQNISQEIDMLISQQVESVAADGDAKVLSKIVSAQATIDGEARQYSDEQIASMQPAGPQTISPTGAVVAASPGADSAGDPTGYLRLGQAQSLPTEPIGVDGQWRSTISALGLTIYTRSTLVSVDKTANADVATIATKYYGQTSKSGMSVHDAPGKLYLLTRGSGVDKFDMESGTLLSMQTTLQTTATMAPPAGARGAAASPVMTHLTITSRMHIVGSKADGAPS